MIILTKVHKCFGAVDFSEPVSFGNQFGVTSSMTPDHFFGMPGFVNLGSAFGMLILLEVHINLVGQSNFISPAAIRSILWISVLKICLGRLFEV